VEIHEPEALAKRRDVLDGFMISGHDVYALRPPLHDGAHFVEPTLPTYQVTRGEIVIGIDIHKLFKRLRVIVKVGKDQ
jgi:hypothetical protein